MKVLSLFANVGFGEYYFDRNGFDVVVANELLDDRVEFYKKFHSNSTNLIAGDIAEQITKNNIISSCLQHGNIDLIMATPPCQGMSIANAQKDKDDIRNTLIVHAMEVFNKVKPKYMLIENVPQMAKTFINHEGNTVNIIKFIKSQLPEGFECHCKVLNAKNLGTAQSRSRSICLISKNGEWQHPKSFDELITVRDVIDDFSKFPTLNQSENSDEWDIPWHFAPKHNAKHVEWMTNTGTGKTAFDNELHYPHVIEDGEKRTISGFKTTYKRMDWDSPAPTVTMTNGSISSQNNVHPGRKYVDGTYSDARVLTIRELLAICGLPIDCLDKFAKKEDDGSYKYDYSPNFIRKVIGEMFLPRMALSIIKTINHE
jgi:DNA (cytosine-5)-methyltransferase 1